MIPPKPLRWKNGTAPDAATRSASSQPTPASRPGDPHSQSSEPASPLENILQEPSDELLAIRVATRDMDAFGLLYDRFSRPVFAMAGHMLGVAEAEEASQEIFMRLWHKASQYDPARGPFSHWFLSIARNHLLDRLRARTERQRVLIGDELDSLLNEAPDPRVDLMEEAWQNQRGAALAHALRQIPAEQRRAIVLAYFGGLSQSEISMHLDVPLGTVKKRIRLGLQKLRVSLSPRALLDLDPNHPLLADATAAPPANDSPGT